MPVFSQSEIRTEEALLEPCVQPQDVLAADFAIQLCHRLCEDASSYLKSKGVLPDQIASVKHLPVSLSNGPVEVSGTMTPGRDYTSYA